MTQHTQLKELFERIRIARDPEYAKSKEEEKKRKEEELQRKEAERIRKEGEVKALFDEIKVYGKNRYVARIQQLLEFLKLEKNAITFWENPHIRKLYDVSNQINFLFSIYTEELYDETAERDLHNNYANPFYDDTFIVFFERISRINHRLHYEIHSAANTILELSQQMNGYISKTRLYEDRYNTTFLWHYERDKYIKSVKYADLLDKNVTVSRLARAENERFYFINPLFFSENNTLRLDAYAVWRNVDSLSNEWGRIERKAPAMIKLLDELVRTRKIYLKEIKKRERRSNPFAT